MRTAQQGAQSLPERPGTSRRAVLVTLASVIRAEGIKFRTLPSYPITAMMVLAMIVGLGLLDAFSRSWVGESAGFAPDADSTTLPFGQFLNGMQYAYVVFGVLATVFLTSEYTQSTIQPSLLSVPKRLPMLVAKMVIMGIVGVIVGVLASSVLLLVVPTVLSDRSLTLDESTESVVRVIAGSGLSLGLIAVLATGLAALIRSLVAAFTTVVVLLTVAPIALSTIPFEWAARLMVYLPSVAGSQYLSPDPATALIDPWWGVAVLTAWASASAVAGGLTLLYRDA